MEDSCKPNSLQPSSDTVHVEIGGLLLGAPWQENEALGSARTWAPSPSSSSTSSKCQAAPPPHQHNPCDLTFLHSDNRYYWGVADHCFFRAPRRHGPRPGIQASFTAGDVAAQYYPSGAYRFKQQ